MKFYNPFKPHLCELYDGSYAIRKLSVFGWTYLDIVDSHWWLNMSATKYFSFDSIYLAQVRLQKYQKQGAKFSTRIPG